MSFKSRRWDLKILKMENSAEKSFGGFAICTARRHYLEEYVVHF